MKSWKCSICENPVSELGAYVKISGNKYAHLSCFSEEILKSAIQTGREQVIQEQREALKAEQERQEQKTKQDRERERARALAQENQRLEGLRLKAMTQQAQDQIKKETQGESQDRFLLLEIDPDDAVRISQEKAQREQELKAKQEADALILKTCVRCKVLIPEISKEHPRHCDNCWNDEGTGQGAKIPKQDLEQEVKDALKRGVRPLEIE